MIVRMFSGRNFRGVFAFLALTSLASTARAELHFAQPTIDAGEAKMGAALAREFAFKNTGPETVEIMEIQASCGCMKPKLEQRFYKPGETGKLRVEVNTLTQSAGPHSWRTGVRYRQGDAPRELDLMLTATIIAEIAVEPAEMMISADRAISHELRLIDRRAKPLTITALESTSPKLAARVTGETRDGANHLARTIRLDVAGDFPEGRHEEVLTIHTDDPLYRELRVPVRIVKRSRQRVAALPASVALTAPRGQAIPAKIVRLRDADNGSVEIERLTPSDPAIHPTWARGPGANATLRISVDRARMIGDELRGSVEVRISKPAAEVVTIPVSVTLR